MGAKVICPEDNTVDLLEPAIADGYDSPKGYTPMSGCSLPVDTPFENIQEMMDTVTDVGYPVRIERVEELIEEVEKRMA